MNGYFQIDTSERGTYLKLFAPTENGVTVTIQEVMDYLDRKKVAYDIKTLGQAFTEIDYSKPVFLNPTKMLPIAECSYITIDNDFMTATARFYPGSNGGRPLDEEQIMSECRLAKVVYGVDEAAIASFLKKKEYCKDYVIARGTPVKEGTDGKITYHFNTDNRIRPTLNEDGTVDFFHLNLVNHCKEGEVLATLTPEVRGVEGKNVLGEVIKPREVKRRTLAFGLNIELSEDKLTIKSKVNGHVTLTGGKVFVSDVMEVVNVDNSTGNIDYEGNVVVTGNVNTNFSIKTTGDIEVRGVVEGAHLEAGGNIVLQRGINGMARGTLKAGGNVVAKFIENATVEAGGYVETNSILHSKVQAGTEINVMSHKGFITGGEVTATSKICVRTLGSNMGADTLVTVGVNPTIINRMAELNQEIADAQKNLKSMLPVMEAMKKKLAAGVKFTPDQVKQVQTLAATVKASQEAVTADTAELETLKAQMEAGGRASVEVAGTVYPGTIIAISDVSKVIKDAYKYCRFVREKGDVHMTSL